MLTRIAMTGVFIFATAPLQAGQFTAQFENDLWGSGADQHYTHGSRFSWSSDNELGWVQGLTGRIAKTLPWMPQLAGQVDDVRFNAALGQNIYTPEDIRRSGLIADDRPYAGWLYLAAGAVVQQQKPGYRQIDSMEINLGIVGPSARADKVQRAVHKQTDSPIPQGWDNQLKDEPGVALMVDRQWVFPLGDAERGAEWDMTPHVGGALGNVFTHLAAGLTFRVGKNLAMDYGPPTIRPSKPGSNYFTINNGQWGWYLFAGVEGRAVGRNIFLDGNTYKSSHRVDRDTWVADGQLGAVLMFSRFRITFTNVFRSKEFKHQQTPSEFGAIGVTLLY
ncbi:MAG: lipid A deacylase LpxR family protein [Gammaproteobacteria bacterium]